MSWRKVLVDRSCGDPRAYRLIQARIDKTPLRSGDCVKSLCSNSEFGINGVWNSSDNKSFAIYDTMRHKLVIMARASYKREKTAAPNLK